jgi:hypothetical protein
LGNGDGTFRAGYSYSTPFGFSVDRITFSDFNHDGKADLAILRGNNLGIPITEDVVTFKGNGDGTFAPPVTIATIKSATHDVVATDLYAADFNGDGKQDIAVGYELLCALRCSTYATNIYPDKGDGTFAAPPTNRKSCVYDSGGFQWGRNT